VLAELERTAAAAGLTRIVLETGIRQPEAVALYTSAGYTPMPAFGHYADSPTSRYFAKALPAPVGPEATDFRVSRPTPAPSRR
jgi:ribosomal protein S18 acetylase RimI-like enzyme